MRAQLRAGTLEPPGLNPVFASFSQGGFGSSTVGPKPQFPTSEMGHSQGTSAGPWPRFSDVCLREPPAPLPRLESSTHLPPQALMAAGRAV